MPVSLRLRQPSLPSHALPKIFDACRYACATPLRPLTITTPSAAGETRCPHRHAAASELPPELGAALNPLDELMRAERRRQMRDV